MTPDALEALLRRWGALRGGHDRERDVPLGATRHPLDVARDFAPGTRRTFVRQRLATDRAGQARRALMAAGAGGVQAIGYRMLPAAYVDPVPCHETRAKAGQPWQRVTPVPADIARLEAAVRDLESFAVRRATVLRVQYCSLGAQAAKAEEVAEQLHTDMPLRLYRDELAHARTWVHGRLA